ncbi:hypothetical protein N3K66_001609 [Trichothecium roseum]|uniref:Uncharacterized protein n=1 Tax=Trichothecium roseum TaxID=47278 RepID=A0ACC0VF70_9HYPO|nr:hypothetical protein N3K66_001609 [Trichothecium roseum]
MYSTEDPATATLPDDEEAHYTHNWSKDDISVTFFIDPEDYKIFARHTILGTDLGVINGNIKDTLRLGLRLEAVNGLLTYYPKHGCEIWVKVDVEATADGKKTEDNFKIVTV